jgi:hypothetical protein
MPRRTDPGEFLDNSAMRFLVATPRLPGLLVAGESCYSRRVARPAASARGAFSIVRPAPILTLKALPDRADGVKFHFRRTV